MKKQQKEIDDEVEENLGLDKEVEDNDTHDDD